ncbi:hypothetical protein PFMC_01952 [Plasmodium falciparum CAMP/Malaysia]|uniref:Calponin-homology (CH) domain-containing protein n=1 Tax=Plasmodium falciparum (isolate Camp / Malaysia) TaxID=5835 RepID=A0A024X9D2_PLAFC|nr:hypothetical protein PFMC_01952 [Plasmodium falciparum CAMP/Malaysia]
MYFIFLRENEKNSLLQNYYKSICNKYVICDLEYEIKMYIEIDKLSLLYITPCYSYNELTKYTCHHKNKERLYKTRNLIIYSFSVIISWINSMSICDKIVNEYNIYDLIKSGVVLLKIIKIYRPHLEIINIFSKAIKKKCALHNLEKVLEVVYKNNPHCYTMVSSIDIYDMKRTKVNLFLIQIFDMFEFQSLKKISTTLLRWYDNSLKTFSLRLNERTINDPFYINKEYDKQKYTFQMIEGEYRYKKNNEINDKKEDYDNIKENLLYNSEKEVLKDFASYILYKDKEEHEQNKNKIKINNNKYNNDNHRCCSSDGDIPHIVKDFSNCIKIFFIFYKYGYILKKELINIFQSDRKNNIFYSLKKLMKKLHIPIVLQNIYLNNPCEVVLILQLKYIYNFIMNNDKNLFSNYYIKEKNIYTPHEKKLYLNYEEETNKKNCIPRNNFVHKNKLSLNDNFKKERTEEIRQMFYDKIRKHMKKYDRK